MPGLLDGTETVGIEKEVGRGFSPPRLEHPCADSERGGDGYAGGDGMISSKKALEAAQTIIDYCKGQTSCQNCIFRLHGADHWKCHVDAFDFQDVIANIVAKRKNNGYL